MSACSTSSLAFAPCWRARSRTARQGRVSPVVWWSGARANASAACRSAGPSPSASWSAFSPSPRLSFAAASAVSGGTPRRLQRLRELAGRRRVEAHGLAAAGDRRQDLRELVGEEDENGVGRRFLERLQQRVRGLVVHRVRALEHEDAVGRLERRMRRGGDDRLGDVSSQHLVGAGGGDPRQVGVRAVLCPELGVVGVLGVPGQQLGRRRPGPLPACRCPPGRGAGRRVRARP